MNKSASASVKPVTMGTPLYQTSHSLGRSKNAFRWNRYRGTTVATPTRYMIRPAQIQRIPYNRSGMRRAN